MKLPELELPKDREAFIKDVCKCFNAQSLIETSYTFKVIKEIDNGPILEAKLKNRTRQVVRAKLSDGEL